MANSENLREPWKPGESGNPNGRPRKMVSQVIADINEAGIENVTKAQVRGCIEVLLNCKEDDLRKYAKDKDHSVMVRMVARHLLKSGDNERVLQMMLDRAFGKPDQSKDITSGGEKITNFKVEIVNNEET